jgi:hypothetical protein
MDSAPTLPGDQRKTLSIDPLLFRGNGPKADALILSHHPATEVLAFYRKHLAGQGWIEADYSKEQPAPDEAKGARWYDFRRIRALVGTHQKAIVSDETLGFVIDITPVPERPKGTIKVEFSFEGSYAWDKPSQLPNAVLGPFLGEYMILIDWLLAPL